MAKKRISYGKTDLIEPDSFDAKNVKERITIWIDEEVLNGFRQRAREEGTRYQSLINKSLREALAQPSLAERVKRLEKKLGSD
jgi:uncharacterized protein (DUF4415 family)